MTILTFIEMLICVFTLSEYFSFLIPFMYPLWLLNKPNSMILATSRATRPFDGRVTRLSETEPYGSFKRSYTTPLDSELHCS